METTNSQIAKLFAGGNGTEANPYQISTAEQLQNLNQCLGDANKNNHYVLNNDIDLTSYLSGEGNNNGQGWSPITFYGKLDGKGHKVSGLWINKPSMSDVGLFAETLSEAYIKNIGLEIDSSKGGVKGNQYVGGLVGLNGKGCIISNSYVTGNVSGNKFAGGLVGANNGNTIDSYATGDVAGNFVGNGEYVGGLTGLNTGNISGSYATGNVSTGDKFIGGLVGANQGPLSDSYATGNVIASATALDRNSSGSIGGLVGVNGDREGSTNTISNCHATGNVSGNQIVGGFAGQNFGVITSSYASGNVKGEYVAVGGFVGANMSGKISNGYAAGNVRGGGTETFVGGFVGANSGGKISYIYACGHVTGTGDSECIGSVAGVNGADGEFSNCYCDTQVSGISSGAGKTTAEMKNQSTYVGWDFEKIWKINPAENNGYPILIAIKKKRLLNS